MRRTAGGALDDGLAIARLFVGKGTLAMREAKGAERQTIAASAGDGAVTVPAALLVDTGTSGAAELFAAALSGNQRADLIGERTIGRAATQKLIKLPDGSGLWLSTTRYLTPAGVSLHEKGLDPTVVVDEPDVEFGQPAPTTDVGARKGDRAPRAESGRVVKIALFSFDFSRTVTYNDSAFAGTRAGLLPRTATPSEARFMGSRAPADPAIFFLSARLVMFSSSMTNQEGA